MVADGKQNFDAIVQLKNRVQQMLWIFILIFALAGNSAAQDRLRENKSSGQSSHQSSQPTPQLLSAAMSGSNEDTAAESELLQLANERRREAGVPPLRASENLRRAAREHARLMVERRQLSHQFDGERSLLPRLRDSGVPLDSVGENVAYHASVERAFDALMHSPPHRQNLLDPGFNVAGMAAVWSKGRLYVVQDFAHQLPQASPVSHRTR